MGRAFTDKEREEIREKLRRTGLKILSGTGIKDISIRDIAKQAGIAQGGFYSFYANKDEFILDLMALRVREKTDIMYENREKTVDDPGGFIADLFYKEGMHLKENRAFNNEDGALFSFWNRVSMFNEDVIGNTYLNFLSKMIDYWEEAGYRIECDGQGLLNAGVAAGILFSNSSMISKDYFEEIYRAFCEAQVDRFFTAKRNKDGKGIAEDR
ncbi:MAG: TetR/AcrR family transcriptional regulator [Lachnospiraceae bacterium]|nr:TetR/AcrR family transcriptional regulator [Lachnospiraceae bacterium]